MGAPGSRPGRSEREKALRRARQTPPPHRYLPYLTAAIDLGISAKRLLDYTTAGTIHKVVYLRRVYVDPADVARIAERRARGDRSVKPEA